MASFSPGQASASAGENPPEQQPISQIPTPEYYATSLRLAATRSLTTELFSRVHYQFLSNFLAPRAHHDQQRATGAVGPPVPGLQPQDRFSHVVVHTISKGTINRQDFDHHHGLERFSTFPDPEPGTDQIIFVRGSPSPAWIRQLGVRYKVDPEFFRRHLRYLPGRDYSDLPSLPSAATSTLSLSVVSLYTRSLALSHDQIRNRRDEDSDIVRKNQQTISARPACGETILRKFSTLNDRIFSMEHDISIYIKERKNGSCFAIVLLDNGLNLDRSDGPPCFTRHGSAIKSSLSNEISPNPIIISRPQTVHIGVTHPTIPIQDEVHADLPNSICHVASLLPFYFGMSISNCLTPRPDILFLLSEVFKLVASSECQFLNRISALVGDQQRHLADEEYKELALNTLIYIKSNLDEHKQRLQQNLAFLSARGIMNRATRVPDVAVPQSMSQEGLALIYSDFEELLRRAEGLGASCVDSMGLIMNTAMLKESQKAVERADDQKRLTVLAYLFLPLSLISSIFGMNVKELGTGSQHIWLPGAILIPIAIFTLILFYPRYLKRAIKLFQRPKQVDHALPTYQTQGATRMFSLSSANGTL